MEIVTDRISVQTQGHTHVIDINAQVVEAVQNAGLSNGAATVFVIGSTAAITTTESEPGLINHDLKAFYERIAPEGGHYAHEQTWNDDNGHSHVRASSLGPSLTAPIVDGRLTLGAWQQIILIDFDTRPRRREIVVQMMGQRD